MKAAILAGGKGTRLREITKDQYPKPMVPIMLYGQEYPMLEFILENYVSQGIRDFILLTGYKGQVIVDHFGDGSRYGVNISYSDGGEEMNTAARLRLASASLSGEPFIVSCGDVYLPVKLDDMIDSFPGSSLVHLATYPAQLDDTIPNVAWDEDGFVVAYSRGGIRGQRTGIEAGVLMFKPEALDRIPQGIDASITELLYGQLIQTRQITCHPTDVRFYDVGTPQRLSNFSAYAQQEHIRPLSLR